MDKKLLFVFNPRAGKARIKPNLSDIIDEFVKNGYWVTAYTTQDVGDATQVVREQAGQYDMVVCSGGDGTLNEVVSGLIESKVDIPVGYIPAGTTNDYGTSLGIPKNMVTAAQMIMGGKDFQSDLGVMNGKKFVYVAAFGAFTEVSYQTNQQFKNMLGHAAYVLEGMKSLASIKAYKMEITVDGETIEDEFILGMITNTVSVGGFKNLTGQEVMLDDGVFEAIFIKKASNPLAFQEMMADLVIEPFNSKYICRYKASHVVIESEEEVAWTLDGEYGGDFKTVEITNLSRAFTIRVDEEKMALTSEQGYWDALEENEEEKSS